MIYSSNTFYILVLYVLPRRTMMGKRKNYLIIPSLDLKKMIANRLIASKKNDPDTLNIYIYPEDKRWIYKNKGKTSDMTGYWNNFDLLGR